MSKARTDTETCGGCRYFRVRDPDFSKSEGDCYCEPGEVRRVWVERVACRYHEPIPYGDPDGTVVEISTERLPEKLW